MNAFKSAQMTAPLTNETIDNLNGLRTAIEFALNLPDDRFGPLAETGISREHLIRHDKFIEDIIIYSSQNPTLDQETLTPLLSFIMSLGRAYSNLMAETLLSQPENGDIDAIEQAGRLHPLLNFFSAQAAHYNGNAANELRYEKK